MITIPYLARTIGAAGFGNIAFASAVITWFMSIATWGFNYTATRDVARNRNNAEEVSRIFSNVFWTRLFLAAICFVILMALTFVIPKFSENRLILAVTFLMIPGSVMFPEWLFQALERMKYITILSLLAKFLFTIAVFLLIKEKEDYILQPLLSSLGYIISGVIATCLIIFKWSYRLRPPSFKTIWKTIRGGADVFINNFTPNLYNSMSIVFLGMFHASSANGIMSAGDRALGIIRQFMDVLSRTFFPFLSRRIEKHAFYARVSIITASFFTILLILFSSVFIKVFYTDEFSDAVPVAIILAPSIFFLTVTNVYGTNYLILEGKEQNLRNITILFSIIGLVMGVPLIYFFSYYGAAITITVTRALLAVFIYGYARRIQKMNSIHAPYQ